MIIESEDAVQSLKSLLNWRGGRRGALKFVMEDLLRG